MTLEGAINLNETNDYIIYTMNSVNTGQYGVVVPKNISGTLNMLVDLHMKSSFDGVGNGTKTKEQLISEISDEYNKLKTKYVDGMLVMPMLDEALYQSTVLNGDKQKLFDEVKKIGAITSELYRKLTEQGIDKQRIDQKIILVEKTSDDEKFVSWLKEQSNMANFIDGFLYSELNTPEQVVNPFVDSNNIFGPEQETAPVINDIFANDASSASVAPVESVIPVNPEPVSVTPATPVEPVPVAQVVAETPVVPAAPVEPVVASAPIQSASVDLFGTATAVQSQTPVESVQEAVATPTVSATSVVQPVVDTTQPTQPVVEGPKPVDAAMLEGTIAFTPIPNHPNNPVEESTNDATSEDKGSKGFVNLAILVVILIGVTLISIELGKYLYSVYGA